MATQVLDAPPEGVERIIYRDTRVQGAQVQLAMDIYQPSGQSTAGAVLIWFHAGAFVSGSIQAPGHRSLARWLGGQGMTLVVPQYRLNADRSDLGPEVSDKLKALHKMRMPGFRKSLSAVKSLAALEDGLAALDWVESQRKSIGIDGKIVLGGSSAGAIIALNMVHTAPFIGYQTPAVGGVISYSGGYPYPDLYRAGHVPVFAVHNPADDRVDIASIRQVAARDPLAELIEAPEQAHGAYFLSKGEPRRTAFLRILAQVRRMSGTTAPA